MIHRRMFLLGAPLALGACTQRGSLQPLALVTGGRPSIDPHYYEIYGPVLGEPHPVPAFDVTRIVDPKFLRREVDYATDERPNTVIVDPNEHFAYLVLGNGRAIRYGVGVGRDETYNFQGRATMAWKAKWPRWTPTRNMIAREPERYGQYADGLEGGPWNPLGSRALYLHQNGRDTYYRLHGTPEPWKIGLDVSSGCVRFIDQDIIDLYERVPNGSTVVVLPTYRAPPVETASL